jgi:isorenieratene synthase
VDASRRIGKVPKTFTIAGRDVVLWRDDGGLHAAPDACPHMGASLAGAAVQDGCLVCPWHGLALGPGGHGAWRHLTAFDDGTLTWVQLPGEAPLPRPVLPVRPEGALDAVVRVEARCEPEHIIRNRLDPWHGAHFHPYAFCDLEVIHADDERLRMNVAYRAFGPLVVDVVAEFTTPSARCIAMHIVDGEGRGSVVETHATPLGPGQSAVVEATFATSERDGFGFARRLSAVIRPFVERSAHRLWVDDVAYAERLASLAESAPARSTLRASPKPGSNRGC